MKKISNKYGLVSCFLFSPISSCYLCTQYTHHVHVRNLNIFASPIFFVLVADFSFYIFIYYGWMDDIRQITFTFITAGPIFFLFLFFCFNKQQLLSLSMFFFVLFFLMKNSSCSTTDKTVFYTHTYTHMHAYTNTYPNRFNEKEKEKKMFEGKHTIHVVPETHTHTHKTIISTRRRFLLVVSGHDEQLFSRFFIPFNSVEFFFFLMEIIKNMMLMMRKREMEKCVCVCTV